MNPLSRLPRGAGYTVIDLENDVDPQAIVEAVKDREDRSSWAVDSLLTNTVDSRLRDEVEGIIGGAPLSEGFARRIGADGHGADGFQAVAIARVREHVMGDSSSKD